MPVIHANREASIDEIAAEMDRRGTVIEKLEAERNNFKAKFQSTMRLLSKIRDRIGPITMGLEDEGDRVYFGSTNDADQLRDFQEDCEAWLDEEAVPHLRYTKDPFAEMRELRSRSEKAEALLNDLLGCLKEARSRLTDQSEIDLAYIDEVIAKASPASLSSVETREERTALKATEGSANG